MRDWPWTEGGPTAGLDQLILASHRGPGRPDQPPSGGLAAALGGLGASLPVRWLYAGSQGERPFGAGGASRGVPIPGRESHGFYEGFSNRFYWLLAHGMLPRQVTARHIRQWYWTGYRPANARFADALAREWAASVLHGAAPRRCAVWVHDYHLMRVPVQLRARVDHADLRIGFFLHVPWPTLAEWRAVPGAPLAALARGIAGADLIGLQTAEDATALLECLAYVLPEAEVPDGPEGSIRLADGRRVEVGVFPISVDPAALERRLAAPPAQAWRRRLAGPEGVSTLVRVDRLDPAKNALAGFLAFEKLLEREPERIGRVRFLAFLVPSREGVPEYRSYAASVLAAAQRIAARFTPPGSEPAVQVFLQNDVDAALAGLSLADAVLVNSRRDGMNLVAKEAVVVGERSPALVLSRTAGAAHDLACGALLVRPDDLEDTVRQLRRALDMGPAERRARQSRMRDVIEEYPLARWCDDQLSRLVPEAAPPLLVPSGADRA
jgi:trehalose 6-phosphate synthase